MGKYTHGSPVSREREKKVSVNAVLMELALLIGLIPVSSTRLVRSAQLFPRLVIRPSFDSFTRPATHTPGRRLYRPPDQLVGALLSRPLGGHPRRSFVTRLALYCSSRLARLALLITRKKLAQCSLNRNNGLVNDRQIKARSADSSTWPDRWSFASALRCASAAFRSADW